MIYLYFGSNFSVLNERVNTLINKLNINNIIKYDFSEVSILDIIDEVNYVDLFNEKKLLIVSNFTFKKLTNDEEKKLIKYIENMNDNVIIFKCIDDSLDERKSLTKTLRNKCEIYEIKILDYKDLHEYVTNMFKKNKIETNYNQIKRILDLCDYNPDYTISEVEKMLIYKIGDNKLTDKDIDDVIFRNNEKEIFKFTDAVMSRDIAKSIDSYKVLNSCNVDVVIMIDSLSKQFRLLMQIKELRKTKSEIELARMLGVNPYTIKKLYPHINSYSSEEIANILLKLSDMDIDIKINNYDKNEIMERFLIEL